MAKEIGGVRVVPNPLAADIFADDAIAIEDVNGTVRISLAVAKLDDGVAPSPLSLVVVGRLVMGEQSAQRLAIALANHFQAKGTNIAAAVRTSPFQSN